MLKELYIENLAIIEKATIAFCPCLNVFTGETGAGKSILIGGINAILGSRVHKDIVRTGAGKATITAVFDSFPKLVAEKLQENGYLLSSDEELMISREIQSDGKSSARINGKPATASILKEIAPELIDIHGQHDNRLLMSPEKQREILDSYGNIESLLADYRTHFKAFSKLTRRIKKLQTEAEMRKMQIELLTQKIEDVEKHQFYPDEETDTAEKLEQVRNAADTANILHSVYFMLTGDDEAPGANQLIRKSGQALQALTDYLPQAKTLQERLSVAAVELEDVKAELSALFPDEDAVTTLPALEERMSEILLVKRKYNTDINDLLQQLQSWKDSLADLQFSDNEIDKLITDRKHQGDMVKKLAGDITAKRKEAADKLSKAIQRELVYLDMPNVEVIFDIMQEKVTVHGMDSVEILISANKGETLKPIQKIASGGELSRIMLAIKSVLADSDNVPTMIFDEIDTGISGRAAQKVGAKLARLSCKRQVLCVTHLAQIAAMASTQLLIEKKTENERTYTNVYPLDFEGRKREIARIISGDDKHALSLKNAEEMLLQGMDIYDALQENASP